MSYSSYLYSPWLLNLRSINLFHREKIIKMSERCDILHTSSCFTRRCPNATALLFLASPAAFAWESWHTMSQTKLESEVVEWMSCHPGKHWRTSVTLTAPQRPVQRFGRLAVDSQKVGSIPQTEHRMSVSAQRPPPKSWQFKFKNFTLTRSAVGMTELLKQKKKTSKPTKKGDTLTSRARAETRKRTRVCRLQRAGALFFTLESVMNNIVQYLQCMQDWEKDILLARKHFMAPLIKLLLRQVASGEGHTN